jgi:hypothetical protein
MIEWIKNMFRTSQTKTLALAEREFHKQRQELSEVLERHGLARDFEAMERRLRRKVANESSDHLRGGGSSDGLRSQ